MGVKPIADPEPLRNAFIRSDQYSFIKKGVPAVKSGCWIELGTPEQKIFKDWLTNRYHAPSDDVNQPVDLQAAAGYEEFTRRLLWKPQTLRRVRSGSRIPFSGATPPTNFLFYSAVSHTNRWRRLECISQRGVAGPAAAQDRWAFKFSTSASLRRKKRRSMSLVASVSARRYVSAASAFRPSRRSRSARAAGSNETFQLFAFLDFIEKR